MINSIKKIFRNKIAIKYFSSTFLSLPVSIFSGILIFKNIDPYLMGIWTSVAVFETYGNILRLGVINGMNRELPYTLGENNKSKAIAIASTTLNYTIFNISIIVLIGFFILYTFDFNQYYLWVILVFVIKISLSFYNSYLTGTFRSQDDFNKLSNIQYFMIIIKLISLPLILLGFYGYLLVQLLVIIFDSVVLHYYRPFKETTKFNINIYKELIKVGFPIFVTSYGITLIDSLPKLFILKYGDEYSMGIFSPVLMLSSVIVMLPNMVLTYIYPKLSYHLGNKRNPVELFKKLKELYLLIFLGILFIVSILYFLLDYFTLFFPKYHESLPYLHLSLIIYPFILFKIGHMVNSIFKKYNFMYYFLLYYFIIQIISLISLNYFLSDILQIAIISQAISFAVLLLISIKMNKKAVLSYS